MLLRPSVNIDLCVGSLIDSMATLLTRTGLRAQTLGVSPSYIGEVYQTLYAAHASDLHVVILPGIPYDYWFVANERGMYLSEGA